MKNRSRDKSFVLVDRSGKVHGPSHASRHPSEDGEHSRGKKNRKPKNTNETQENRHPDKRNRQDIGKREKFSRPSRPGKNKGRVLGAEKKSGQSARFRKLRASVDKNHKGFAFLLFED